MGPPDGKRHFERLEIEVAKYNETYAEDGGIALVQKYKKGSQVNSARVGTVIHVLYMHDSCSMSK